jgi:hypothetical protein
MVGWRVVVSLRNVVAIKRDLVIKEERRGEKREARNSGQLFLCESLWRNMFFIN